MESDIFEDNEPVDSATERDDMLESTAGLPNTDWSMIHALGEAGGDEDRRAQVLDQLVRRYWPAVYAYVRRTGRSADEAADLTQGFMTTVLLERRLADSADQSRGRFRSFLLASLENYLRERHRYDTRQVRSHEGKAPLPFSQLEMEAAEGARYATPEAAFVYHFSAQLVRAALKRVQHSCLQDGLEAHWTVFERRIVRPVLTGEAVPPLATLSEQLGLKDEAQASNLVITVKRRFAHALREEIAGVVNDADDVEAELRDLFRGLERPT